LSGNLPVERNAVRRAYMCNAEYWPERVAVMQGWADYLHALRDGAEAVPQRRV
jgi:hypothetical protein